MSYNHYRTSIERLMAEGYTLLRLGNVKEAKGWPLTYSDQDTGYGNWRVLKHYETQRERDEEVDLLVETSKYLAL